MARLRLIPRPAQVKNIIPFRNAEEAWFWYVRSEKLRREGAHFGESDSNDTRPCVPDDIYCAVMRLRQREILGGEHLRVLAEFGWRECPPDARVRDEERSLILWDDALDRLTTELQGRGIVRADDERVKGTCRELF